MLGENDVKTIGAKKKHSSMKKNQRSQVVGPASFEKHKMRNIRIKTKINDQNYAKETTTPRTTQRGSENRISKEKNGFSYSF